MPASAALITISEANSIPATTAAFAEGVLGKRPHPAMRVGDLAAKKQIQNPREQRDCRCDGARASRPARSGPAARTHDQVVAGAQLVDERAEVGKVVGIVGVRHHDEAAARLFDARAAARCHSRGGVP